MKWRLWAIAATAFAFSGCGGGDAPADQAAQTAASSSQLAKILTSPGNETQIDVLSNRADLISDGDALLEITWPAGAKLDKAKVTVDGVNVTAAFATRANGRYMGLVTGLKNGTSEIKAHVPGSNAFITITNHPIGGPVFAGAQLQPWICATVVSQEVTVMGNAGQTALAMTRASGLLSDPVDAQCNTATTYSYYYQPVTAPADCTFTITGANPCFVAFTSLNDPATRPANAAIADFTNDRGDTVKSLIRVERGVLNRNIYQLVTFYDPLDQNKPWAPSKGWNQKLHWKFGAGASTSRFMEPPGVATIFDQNALRRGFMVASSHLTNNGSNSNNTLAAETVMMVKERIIENYGEIRYTMSDGGSGGSIMQHSIASAYPGLTNGLMTTISYPDQISIWMEVADCGLLQATVTQAAPGGYYSRPGSPGELLSQDQRVAINGHAASTGLLKTGFCNSWTGSFLNASNPASANNCGFGFPAALVYNATTNPNGVRCDTYDHDASMVGTFVDTDGIAKANVPRDNVGMQYGLKALQLPAGDPGAISPEEFVLLNEGIGGYTADRVWIPSRMQAAPAVLNTYYSGGLVSDGRQLAKVPMIDLRTQNGLGGDIHMNWRSKALRDRLDRDHGSHANSLLWSGVQTGLTLEAFITMNTWLTNIESDPSANPIEVKVVNNKPAGAVDFCQVSDGATPPVLTRIGVDDPACPVKYFGSPRIASGGPLAENVFKCQLKPLNFGDLDYTGIAFTLEQQARLHAVFPDGVCDWSKLGVSQVPVNPWTTFAGGPGGVPLGDPPVSSKHGSD